MILEFPADNVPDFFFIPCDPFTHEELGYRENGTWRVEYDADALELLFNTNVRGKDPEIVALYEEAAERARLYGKMDSPARYIARGKLDVMNRGALFLALNGHGEAGERAEKGE
jgi:hypothetical protein